MITSVSTSRLGSGADCACCAFSAGRSPLMEMMLPDATATYGGPPAALTIPALSKTGGSCCDSSAPLTDRWPRICAAGLSASRVKVTCPCCLLLVAQVPSQSPPRVDCSSAGGSPLEKVTETFPASSGAPQSSFTSTRNATGQPAETVNDGPNVVIAGSSFVGVHGRRSATRMDFASGWLVVES